MQEIKYQIVRSLRRRKTSSISISPEGNVIVSVPPWVSPKSIETLVGERASWIKKALSRFSSNQKPKTKLYSDGEKHLYFGEEYPLSISAVTGIATARLQFLYNRFQAMVPSHHSLARQSEDIKEAMFRWYLDNGKRIITEKVNYFAKLLNVSYNRIVLKKVSSIWGSCSSKNNLNFNRKLIMAPHHVVDYVVIHEVCHLIHRHHRKSFWDLVKSFDPEYRSHIRWLKQNHHLLTI